MIILQATIPISYFILRLIPNFFPVSSMKFPLRLVSHRENKLLDFFGRHNGVFTCVCIFGMFSRLLSSFLIGNFWYVLLVFSKTECMYRVSQNVSWEASQNMFSGASTWKTGAASWRTRAWSRPWGARPGRGRGRLLHPSPRRENVDRPLRPRQTFVLASVSL